MSILILNQYSYRSIDYRCARKYLFVDKPSSNIKVAMSYINLIELIFFWGFFGWFSFVVDGLGVFWVFFNNEVEIRFCGTWEWKIVILASLGSFYMFVCLCPETLFIQNKWFYRLFCVLLCEHELRYLQNHAKFQGLENSKWPWLMQLILWQLLGSQPMRGHGNCSEMVFLHVTCPYSFVYCPPSIDSFFYCCPVYRLLFLSANSGIIGEAFFLYGTSNINCHLYISRLLKRSDLRVKGNDLTLSLQMFNLF